MAKGKYEYWLTKDGLILLEGWARDGLADQQIAKDKMGIAYSTFREWKKKYSALSAALKKNKDIVDREVENALFKKAMGLCEIKETTFELVEATIIDPETYDIKTVPGTKIKTVIKQVAPDTTAQIFWLKNRKPKQWRDKQDVEMSGSLNNPFEGLTTDELRQIAKNK